jgi:serine kinase of HPr protein (carbohydrate metabolism regulator)
MIIFAQKSINTLIMKVEDIAKALDARIVYGGEQGQYAIEAAFASDLMSDVLTLKHDHVLLITGLANTQTIRTAEMSDIKCIIFARNKKATEEMLRLAEENDIIIIECRYSVFRTCGILFRDGVKPIY